MDTQKPYTLQPGDFLIQSNTYNNNVVYAIFEGKKICETKYSAPDYSLLLKYETKPYSYTGESRPTLDVGTYVRPCKSRIYTITNSSVWRVCTPEEKDQLLSVLAENNYAWDEETWSLIDTSTGEIVNHIVRPKFDYNGKKVRILRTHDSELLESIALKTTESTTAAYAYGGRYGNEYGGRYIDMYD